MTIDYGTVHSRGQRHCVRITAGLFVAAARAHIARNGPD